MHTMQANWLCYDIPEGSGIANPTGWLLPIAVRVNKSCWVIMTGDIPWMRLNAMRKAGVNYYVIPFAAEAAAEIVKMACENIRRDLREAVLRARDSIAGANRRLEDADPDAPEAARRVYERNARAIIRKARKLIESIKSAAAKFGVTESMMSLGEASSCVAALQVATHHRAKVYAEAVEQVRRIMGPADAMAVAAGRSLVDGRILADYLDDHDGSGAAVRDAFS